VAEIELPKLIGDKFYLNNADEEIFKQKKMVILLLSIINRMWG